MNGTFWRRLAATLVFIVLTLLGLVMAGALSALLVELFVFGPERLKDAPAAGWQFLLGDLHLSIGIPAMILGGVLGSLLGSAIIRRAGILDQNGAARVYRKGPF